MSHAACGESRKKKETVNPCEGLVKKKEKGAFFLVRGVPSTARRRRGGGEAALVAGRKKAAFLRQ